MTDEWQIEMLWACSVCSTFGNSGLRDRYCGHCGHKKDATDTEYMPDDTSESAALVGQQREQAKAGPDWICKYCDALQNQLNQCCGNCGARDRGETPPAPRVMWSSATEAPVAASERPPNAPRRRWAPWSIGAALAALTMWFGWWLFAPRVVDAVVTGTFWKHDVVVERYQVSAHDGFDPESEAFDVAAVGMRHHHYDRVHVGSHREPYQESYTCGQSCYTTPRSRSCTSNGNGTATCSNSGGDRVCRDKTCYRTAYRTVQDYADVSRQRMYYTWRSWGWERNRVVSKSGHDSHETAWPSAKELEPPHPLAAGEKERTAQRERYTVVFGYEDENVSINPATEAEFLKYETAQRRRLKVNRAGSVEVLP